MKLWPFGNSAPPVQQVPAPPAFSLAGAWRYAVWPSRARGSELAQYEKVSLIYSCIEERANSIASVVPEVWVGTDRASSDDPVSRLMRMPDEDLPALEWWRVNWIHHDLTGDVFLYRRRLPNGEVAWYEPLRPDYVHVIARAGTVTGYRYGPFNGGGPIIPPADIAHFRSFDPRNRYYGLGPTGVCMREGYIDEIATKFTAEWVLNGGKSPGGFLTTTEHIETEDDATRIRAAWHAGQAAQSGGDVALLDSGTKYQSASPMTSPELPTLRAHIETRICGVFGVDPRLVSANTGVQASSGTADYANAYRGLWELTLVPFYKRLQDWMTMVLARDFGDEYSYRFNTDNVGALRESQDALSSRVLSQFEAGLLTVDQALVALGREPLGGRRGPLYAGEVDALEALTEDAA